MTSVREELGKMIVSDFKSSLKINTDDLYSNQVSLFKIKQEESLKIFQDNIREYNDKYSQDGPKKIMEDLRNKLEILSGEDANLENLEKILFDIQIFANLSLIVNNKTLNLPVKIQEIDWEPEDFLHKNLLKKDEDDNCLIS
jgi:ABC-type antimicrobial peptide transport system permease subunit